MKGLLQFSINVRKSHRQPQHIVQTRDMKMSCCSYDMIYTLIFVGGRIQNASEKFLSHIHLYFVNFAFFIRPPPLRHKQKI